MTDGAARPGPVRLDDLAEPRFAPHVVEVLDAMGEMGKSVELTADSVIAAARAQTGLDDLHADGAFDERLAVFLHALDTEAPLSDAGRLIAHTQVVSFLANRLLLFDYTARHSDVHDVPIERPIVIVGLPRTGTTHLHNLLSSDPALRSLPYWESLEPVPPRPEQALADTVGPRKERCAAGLWLLDEAMPHFKRMHEMTVDQVHEEIQLLAIDLDTMLFETTACMPSWRDHYKAHDCTDSYRFLRLALQVCAHQRGGPQRWVLKSPQHLEQLRPLTTVFPDATVVFTHRDPAAVVISYVTMGAYTARLSHRAPIDVAAIGAYWRDRILDLYRAAVRDRDLVPPERSLDVRFDDFMADEAAVVEHIYELAGQPLDHRALSAMDAFRAEHGRGRHGAVEYDFAPFGLDPTEIRRAAGFYVDRFAVALEPRWS